MSGGYDNKIVRGPGDLITPMFSLNNLYPVNQNTGGAVAPVFNIIGGASFYLNGIQIYIPASAFSSSGFISFNVYAGPNNNSIVGATLIAANGILLPTTAPGGQAGSVFVLNLDNIGYRNLTGVAQYLHVVPSGGNAVGWNAIFKGGQTALLN